jgi:transcriptional regulator with XRE-family HTH domain
MIPAINMPATGAHIRELMDQRGYSVKDIQQKFGFYTPQAVYKWVNGDTLPTLDNLVILASILEVSVDDILVLEWGEVPW